MSRLTYQELRQLARSVPQGKYIEIYFFILKTSSGLFKIKRPQKCRIKIDTHNFNITPYLHFNYMTATGNWSKQHNTALKNNAFYFKTLQEAENSFEVAVKNAQQLFTKQIQSANIALIELDKY